MLKDAYGNAVETHRHEVFVNDEGIVPTCDLCGGPQYVEGDDWNGETGSHYSCERSILFASMEIPNSEIKAGDRLVEDESILIAYSDAEASSAMPGLVRVECAFGTLYLDPDSKTKVVRD